MFHEYSEQIIYRYNSNILKAKVQLGQGMEFFRLSGHVGLRAEIFP